MLLAAMLAWNGWAEAPDTTANPIEFIPGPVNGVLLTDGDQRWAIYGDPRREAIAPDMVFLTHYRRDAVWHGLRWKDQGTELIAPRAEQHLLENAETFWLDMREDQFHDYAQQSTKVVARSVAVNRTVEHGDVIPLGDRDLHVIATPGYTRGSVSYWLRDEHDRLWLFCGDLMMAGGHLVDLFSFQDELPSINLRGYHGYGVRLAQLLDSLNRVAALKPDRVIPLRGPILEHPLDDIRQLQTRIKNLFHNYLTTTALHWYFKEPFLRESKALFLRRGSVFSPPPYASLEAPPPWMTRFNTSRILRSEDGYGFLIDCGYPQVIEHGQSMIESGRLRAVEGIFVTHFHDDHTDAVQAGAEAFGCPVYVGEEWADVLERPAAYHLPAMTSNPIHGITPLRDRQQWDWRGFRLEYIHFPGQTLHHGALLVSPPHGPRLFLVGDSFTPSGLDDYCVPNRNLLGDDYGFLRCLRVLDDLGSEVGLVNQHVGEVFRFSDAQRAFMETSYRERITQLAGLFPWPDPNFGTDPDWARFDPYRLSTRPGTLESVVVRVLNHGSDRRRCRIRLNDAPAWGADPGWQEQTLAAGREGVFPFQIQVPEIVRSTPPILTADVQLGDMQFYQWIEMLVVVESDGGQTSLPQRTGGRTE